MKRLLALLIVLVAFGTNAALAEIAFVIEGENAEPAVGVQVSEDTNISIDPEGHLVIMTESGQMIRKDGPYDGTAAVLFKQIETGTSMDGGMLESLLELAEVSGTAEEQLGAVRGAEIETAEVGPNMISTSVTVFCLTEGVVPEFFTSKAPDVDEPLVVRRRVRPIQYLEVTWPAGATSLPWPTEWELPEEGRYVWALGQRGSAAVKLVELEDEFGSPLEQAAVYYDEGCESQAKALFRDALFAAANNN
jgi:hypothetical protein